MIEKLNLNKKEFTDEEIISLLGFAELSLLNLPEKEKVKIEKTQADLVNREDSVSDEEIISLLGPAELEILQQCVKPRFASGAGKLEVTMILSSEKDLEKNYCHDRVEMQVNGEKVCQVNVGEPENNDCDPNFITLFKLGELLKRVHKAGKAGVEMEIIYKDI